MTIAGFRRSRLRVVTVALMLVSYLAVLVPSRPAKAASSGALGGSSSDTAGASSLAAKPGANDVEGLAAVNLATGSASASYPFELPQARGDAQPSLGLRFNQMTGLGFAGMGWTLNVTSIVRRGRAGIPRFQDAISVAPSSLKPQPDGGAPDDGTDDYYIDGQLLIPVSPSPQLPARLPTSPAHPYLDNLPFPWALYRTEIDDGSRYFFDGLTWVKQTKSGHMIEFGVPLDSSMTNGVELTDSATATAVGNSVNGFATNGIYRWLLVRDSDAIGNTVYYAYGDLHAAFPSGQTNKKQYLTDIFDTPAQAPTPDLTATAPAASTFAHHVNVSWTYAQYPSGSSPSSSIQVPYMYSPIWKALPYVIINAVVVTSAIGGTTQGRFLLRGYQLSYTYNDTLTQPYLSSIQPVGNCLQGGEPIGENSAAIGSGLADVTAPAACIQQESMPPRTFTYYGISKTTPTSIQKPLLSKNNVTGTTLPGSVMFLADLNGDAVDEIVVGNSGQGMSSNTANPWGSPNCAFACTSDPSNQDQFNNWLRALSFVADVATQNWPGFVFDALNLVLNPPHDSSYPTQCTGCTRYGPTTQGQGSNCALSQPSATSTAQCAPWSTGNLNYFRGPGNTRSLTSVEVDDSLWGFSIMGDWTSSGSMNLLDLAYIPANELTFEPTFGVPYRFNPTSDSSSPVGYDTVTVSQFGGIAAGSPSLQLRSLPASDITTLQEMNGTYAATAQSGFAAPEFPFNSPGQLTPSNAVDVDGDGLPDLALAGGIQNDPKGNPTAYYSPYITTSDRRGVTHPFAVANQKQLLIAPATYDPQQYSVSSCFDPNYPNCSQNTALRLFADMDGDGLADMVIARTSDSAGSNSTSTTGPEYLNISILPSRGDGRFGIPDSALCSSGFSCANGFCTCDSSNGLSYGGAYPTLNASTNVADPISPGNIYPTQASVVRFGDLNGDGLGDFAVLEPAAGLSVCLRYGGNWDNAQYRCASDSSVTGTDLTQMVGHANLLIGDLDGSGVNQLLYVPPTLGGTVDYQPGSGLKHITVEMAPGPVQSTTALPAPIAIRVLTPSYQIGSNGVVVREGLLKSVSNGRGGVTTFDQYENVANLPANELNGATLPVPAWVVRQTTTTNSLTGNQAVSIQKNYKYNTPVYDARDREFVGFTSVQETTAGTAGEAGSPATVVKTTFATTTCSTANDGCRSTSEDYSSTRLTRGLPIVVEVSDNASSPTKFSTTVYDYSFRSNYQGMDGRSGQSLQDFRKHTYLWGDNQTVPSSPTQLTLVNGQQFPVTLPTAGVQLLEQHFFDSNANETDVLDLGAVGSQDQPILQHRAWSLSPGDQTGWSYRVTQAQTSYATSSAANYYGPIGATTQQPVREYDMSYDSYGRLLTVTSAPLQGVPPVPSGYPTLPGSGALANGASNFLLYSQGYDSNYGTLSTIGSDNSSCKETISYDSQFHLLPAATTAYPHGCGNAGALTTTFSFLFDEKTSVISPDQETTVYRYDDFGRILEVDAPDPASTPTAPGTTPALVVSKYTDASPTSTVAFNTIDGKAGATLNVGHVRYYDGLGELRAALDQTGSNGAVVLSGGHSSFSNGRVNTQYQPWLSTASLGSTALPTELPNASQHAPGAAVTQYDGLGRALRGTDFNGAGWQVFYHDQNLAVESHDQKQTGGSGSAPYTMTTKDGHGRVKSTDLKMVTPAQDIVTTYDSYLATGEPTSITTGGVQRTMTYDSLGRMATNTEPNAGTSTYWHDLDGRVVGTTDNRGCGQNIWYDQLGRLVARDYVPCANGSPVDSPTQATYSPPTTDSTTGLPTGDGTEAFYAYDPTLGRVTDIFDLARHDTFQYDGRGRVTSVTRALVNPPTPSSSSGSPPTHFATPAIGSRYTSQTFTRTFQYSLADRVTSATSGAVSLASYVDPETTKYTYDGKIQSIQSTAGGIIGNATYFPSGAVKTIAYNDTSQTLATYGYDHNLNLTGYSLIRPTGRISVPGSSAKAWVSNVVPAPSDGSTLETNLTNVTIGVDAVGNPTQVSESGTSTWPSGAQSVSQAYTYFDDYRLATACSSTSSNPTCAASDPQDTNVSPYVASDTSNGVPLYLQPEANIPYRFKNLSYQYDLRGNVTMSNDDASDFGDRSYCGTAPAYDSGTDQVAEALFWPPNQSPPMSIAAQEYMFYDKSGGEDEVMALFSASATPVYLYTTKEVFTGCTTPNPNPCGSGYVQCTTVMSWQGTPSSSCPSTLTSGAPGVSTAQGSWCLQGPAQSDGSVVQQPCTDHTGPPRDDDTYVYVWNEMGQLSTAIWQVNHWQTFVQEDYVYDSDGQRVLTIRSFVNGSTTKTDYTVNVFDSLVLKNTTPTSQGYTDSVSTEQVYMAGGLAHAFNDSGNALPSWSGRSNHMFLLYPDHRGNVGFVIDHDTGEVVERTAYLPYGAIDTDFRPQRWNYFREDLKFAGQWDNAEVGLVYMNARYYSPQRARFISPDPLTIHGLAGDPNPYEYANGNPIRFSDPSGLLSQDDKLALGVGGFAAGMLVAGGALSGVGDAVGNALGSIGSSSLAGNLVQTAAEHGLDWGINAAMQSGGGLGPPMQDIIGSVHTYGGTSDQRLAYSVVVQLRWHPLDALADWGSTLGQILSNIGRFALQTIRGGGQAVINERKFDYLFGKATGRQHNIDRSLQNAQQLARVGVYDNAEGRALLRAHFNTVGRNPTNIVGQFSNEYGNFVVRDSLFSGPGGQLKFQSAWKLLESGDYEFSSAIPFGGP